VAALGITLNGVARDEHVPEIERYIRTVKERTRCLFHTLPFELLPKRMTVEMVYTSIFWLNAFPPSDGISEEYGPRAIITGADLDWNVHCKLEFGSYVQVHEEHDNGLAPRTTGALALRPTGNAQGGFLFYSLTTGRKIARYAWTSLPMPGEVIRHVHMIARDERVRPGLAFLDRDLNMYPDDAEPDDPDDESWHPDPNGNQHVYDDDDDENYEYDDESIAADDNNHNDDNYDGVNDNNPFIHEEINQDHHDIDEHYVDDDMNDNNIRDNNENDDTNNDLDEYNNDDVADVANNIPDGDINNENQNNQPHDEIVDEENAQEIIMDNLEDQDDERMREAEEREELMNRYQEMMDERYGARTGRYNLRTRRPPNYGHLHTHLSSTIFTQYSIKRGLNKFQEKGVEAVRRELKQLHDRSVLEPVREFSRSDV
jgi:hypothetical protein